MVIGTSKWDLLKNSYKNKGQFDSILYMRMLENISRTYLVCDEIKNKIKEDICLSYDDTITGIRTTHTNEGFIIHIPFDWIENGNASDSRLIELATFLGHEFVHICYGDIEFLDSLIEGSIRNRRSFTLAALCETRADIIGCRLAVKYYQGYSLNWVKTSNNYMKTGCFNDATRAKIVKKCRYYDIITVHEIFKNIIVKDKFTDYPTVLNSVKSDGRLSNEKRKWMLRILCF